MLSGKYKPINQRRDSEHEDLSEEVLNAAYNIRESKSMSNVNRQPVTSERMVVLRIYTKGAFASRLIFTHYCMWYMVGLICFKGWNGIAMIMVS